MLVEKLKPKKVARYKPFIEKMLVNPGVVIMARSVALSYWRQENC
jgi:hypothetical protein